MSGVVFEAAGAEVGRVDLVDGQLEASGSVRPVVTAWLQLGRAPERFLAAYDGWANGAVTARRV